MSKEIQKINNNVVVPDYIKQGSVRGTECTAIEDITVPRLMLVQALSKCHQLAEENAYIEGITDGDMYNNVTRKNYGKSVRLVPAFYKKEFLVWKDQKLGGGFGGSYEKKTDAQAFIDMQEKPEDWDCVPTGHFYCLLLHDDEPNEQIVVSMSKSKNKVAKDWNAFIRMVNCDSFAKSYILNGIQTQNNNAQWYSNFKIMNGSFVTETVLKEAEDLYEQIIQGHVKINEDYDDVVEESAESAEY